MQAYAAALHREEVCVHAHAGEGKLTLTEYDCTEGVRSHLSSTTLVTPKEEGSGWRS